MTAARAGLAAKDAMNKPAHARMTALFTRPIAASRAQTARDSQLLTK
jgi:hypothetical protein